MCEIYGRDNFEMFTDLLGTGKSVEEIKEYSEVFWKNYKKIYKYEKYIDRIEKGEAEIYKRNSIDKAIEDKFQQLLKRFKDNNPEKSITYFSLNDIQIEYETPLKPEDFEENPFEFYPDEDRIYALGMFKYTYGYWDLLKNEIRNSPSFLFNWTVQTRTVQDI